MQYIYIYIYIYTRMHIHLYIDIWRVAHGVMVNATGNGHSNKSSNPGWDWLYTIGKGMNLIILPPAMGK